jgi:hypothetical protein
MLTRSTASIPKAAPPCRRSIRLSTRPITVFSPAPLLERLGGPLVVAPLVLRAPAHHRGDFRGKPPAGGAGILLDALPFVGAEGEQHRPVAGRRPQRLHGQLEQTGGQVGRLDGRSALGPDQGAQLPHVALVVPLEAPDRIPQLFRGERVDGDLVCGYRVMVQLEEIVEHADEVLTGSHVHSCVVFRLSLCHGMGPRGEDRAGLVTERRPVGP